LICIKNSTIGELATLLGGGEVSALELVNSYIQVIQSEDKYYNAIAFLNPDAEKIAVELDNERKNGLVRGPLHGVPILIKDNIDTADKMMTSAGSLALNGHTVQKDAHLVDRLRRAGAILLGKTNLSEWANFRSTRSSSGWSSRGGKSAMRTQRIKLPVVRVQALLLLLLGVFVPPLSVQKLMVRW
jgi:amidase